MTRCVASAPCLALPLALAPTLAVCLQQFPKYAYVCVCVFVHLHISDIGRYVNRCPWTQYAAILHMTSMRSQFLLLLKRSLKCCHEKCNGKADQQGIPIDIFIGMQ